MAKRRASHEGSVFRESGEQWVAMIELPRGPNGKRRRRKRRARTQAEAQRFLREMRDELATNANVTVSRRTISTAVDDFVTLREAEDLAAGTTQQDMWQLAIIQETIGHRQVIELTVADCDQFLEHASKGIGSRRPISRDQLARMRRLLIRVAHNEMRVGHVVRNVADLSVLPKATTSPKQRRALTHEELNCLLDLAKGSRLVLIDLIGRNGLRPAEARAVRWQDVNLDQAELSVTGQQNKQNQRSKVKTKRSARTIHLDATTLDRLEAWSVEQARHRSKARNAWQDLDILASTSQGTPVDRHSFARSLRGLSRKAGFDPAITPYELRHTAISMQADAGHNSWEIADWAGTSEAMISDVYRHRLQRVAPLRPVAENLGSY